MPLNKRTKKIAYVSGTRADFGLMTPVLHAIAKSPRLELKLYVTGMHLMKSRGLTVREVIKNFPKTEIVSARIPDDTKLGVEKFNAELMKKLTVRLNQQRPDVMLVLGDRPEMLATALVCTYLRIPLAHIHGGDKTTTIDESARHAITKLSHLHFTATKTAANRVKKMGEDEWRIRTVGAPGIDVIRNQRLLPSSRLKKILDVKDDYILITLHPVSEDTGSSGRQMNSVLQAVEKFDLPKVIVYPNADPGSKKMIEVINRYNKKKGYKVFKNLAHPVFLAVERDAAVWIGNSSAGIIEAASFQTPVVNVGQRQFGREQSTNVINVDYNIQRIRSAVAKTLSNNDFRKRLKSIKNIWGDGRASQRIVKILEKLEINERLFNKRLTY